MEGNSSDKFMRVAKAALFGFLGATIIIHITPLVNQSLEILKTGILVKSIM